MLSYWRRSIDVPPQVYTGVPAIRIVQMASNSALVYVWLAQLNDSLATHWDDFSK